MTKEEKELEKQQKEALKKAAKEAKEKEKADKALKVEFPKFLKEYCSKYYDFLFSDQFALYCTEDNAENLFICFPKEKYTYVYGLVDFDLSPSFNEWCRRKHGTIKFDSEILREIKGKKLGDFLGLEISDDFYIVKTVDKEYKFERLKLDVDFPEITDEIDYSYCIKKDLLENNKFKLYYNSEGKPTSVQTDKVLVEAPVKIFKFLQKTEEVQYSVKVGKPSEDKSRVIQFASKSPKATIFQQFRII